MMPNRSGVALSDLAWPGNRSAGGLVPVTDGEEMQKAMALVMNDVDFAEDLARTGLQVIHARHTCGHRAAELLSIIELLRGTPVTTVRRAGLSQTFSP